MSGALLEEPVPNQTKPKRDDRAVKIARELAVMMNFIVDSGSTEYDTVASYLTAIARPAIERDYEKALQYFLQAKPRKGAAR